jgi:hypothetical protein
VTEWKLQDVNGDGFPDFSLNSNPMAERIETEAYCDVQEYPFTDIWGDTYYVVGFTPDDDQGGYRTKCIPIDSTYDVTDGNNQQLHAKDRHPRRTGPSSGQDLL